MVCNVGSSSSSSGIVQSTAHEKIPARNSIYAHAQHFETRDDLLLAILKASVPSTS
jgi:hypothetical protein